MSNNELEIPVITVGEEVIADARNIAVGAYAPISGFMGRDDLEMVLTGMRLMGGEVWSLPITVALSNEERQKVGAAGRVFLADESGRRRVKITEAVCYQYDLEKYARYLFGTVESSHPGVGRVFNEGEWFLSGEVNYIFKNDRMSFSQYYLKPEEMKRLFAERKWKQIVAFQTRNVPHRSHEFLQKKALSLVDGLLIQPVIGEKKSGDFRDEVILAAYEVLLEKYYNKGKYVLSILPLRMRYAGPKEAVFHALVRRNYGCTHIIIGRDHAGVGGFYDPLAAHKIFDQFSREELGITALKYGDVKYCSLCGDLVMDGECQHGDELKKSLSGTRIRSLVSEGASLPEEFVRPEVSRVILSSSHPFV